MSCKRGLPYYPDDWPSSLGGRYNMLLDIEWVDDDLLKKIFDACPERFQKRDLIFNLIAQPGYRQLDWYVAIADALELAGGLLVADVEYAAEQRVAERRAAEQREAQQREREAAEKPPVESEPEPDPAPDS